jgi:chemotaxis protein CheC
MRDSVATQDHPLDLLQRIGATGAANATASLSALAGRRVENSYAKVRLVPLEEVPHLFGDPEEVISGILFDLQGDLKGQYIVLFLIRDAIAMIAALTGVECSPEDDLDDLAMSALAEAGNILSSSYLRAIEEATGLKLSPSPPMVAVDMAGGVLTSAVLPMHEAGSEILLIEAGFGDDERVVEGRMMLLPSTKTLPALLRAVKGVGASV